jgi:TolB-like protein
VKSYQEFFAELKRRNVFKVAGIYGIVSFGIIQAADVMLPRLGLPDWTVTFMVAVVVLAFPVALLLAWAFDLTPEGLRRTDAPEPGEIESIMAAPASQRWPAGLLALLGVALIVASTWWIARRTAPDAAAGGAGMPAEVQLASADVRPSLAVLPFADMSPERDQAYFSDGISEEILNTLVGIRELRVAARTSAFAFRGQELDMRVIGDSLGVQYLIEGSVRKAGDQLRITAQLIDAEDGSHLWSNRYDEELTAANVFSIQSQIAEAIAAALRIPLGLDDVSHLVTPTGDLEAYDLYLAARGRMRERGASLPEAIRLFEAAIARDSTWAPAWAGLAEAREVLYWYPEAWDIPPRSRAERKAGFDAGQEGAAQAARRALELDPDNASAHVALGSVHRNRNQWAESEAEYRRALELDPENPEAHLQYGQLLMDVGRLTEAIEFLQQAIVLDPGVVVSRKVLAAARLMAGQYEETLAELDRADRTRTGVANLERWADATAKIALGRYDEVVSLPTIVVFEMNRPEEVARATESLRAGRIDEIPEDLMAPQILMAFGREDAAAELLLEQFRIDPITNIGLHWMPLFDPIREHPAYLAMMREANLEGVEPDRPAAP